MNEIKRKCLGCYRTFDRCQLIKITKLKDGTIKINPTSKEIGRSVYVCKSKECIKNFIKKKKLRSLKLNNQTQFTEIEEKLKNLNF